MGQVRAVGTRVIVMSDTMNPAAGLSTADYQAIADSFDTFVYPVATANFGTPADIDGNGKVIVLYTRAVNELTPSGSSTSSAASSSPATVARRPRAPPNVGEMFYMLAPDPAGAMQRPRAHRATCRRAPSARWRTSSST